MQDEVAAPRWCHGTAAWIDTMNVVLHSPMPMPISSDPVLAQTTPRSGVSVISTALPAISASVPSTAVSRYVVRTISRPP